MFEKGYYDVSGNVSELFKNLMTKNDGELL